MTDADVLACLKTHGVQPSAHRVAIARYVLATEDHPSADDVWDRVRKELPVVSRATVYNTLHLLVTKGLLRPLSIAEGHVVFDPNVKRHHHLLDETTGRLHDVPWEALRVSDVEDLPGFEVTEYQVVLRGRRVPTRRTRP